jgi:hypothetical protein
VDRVLKSAVRGEDSNISGLGSGRQIIMIALDYFLGLVVIDPNLSIRKSGPVTISYVAVAFFLCLALSRRTVILENLSFGIFDLTCMSLVAFVASIFVPSSA